MMRAKETERLAAFNELAAALGWTFAPVKNHPLGLYGCLLMPSNIMVDVPPADSPMHEHVGFTAKLASVLSPGNKLAQRLWISDQLAASGRGVRTDDVAMIAALTATEILQRRAEKARRK